MHALSKKICLLGDFAVGKTSLVRRFVYNRYEDRYLSTLGVKVSRKVIAVPRGDDIAELTIMLWDLAGAEEFDGVRSSYLRGSAGALLVYDSTRPETLDALPDYVADLRAVSPEAPVIVVANKNDLKTHPTLTDERIQSVISSCNAPWYTTSAKTGFGVDEVFRHLGRLLVG